MRTPSCLARKAKRPGGKAKHANAKVPGLVRNVQRLAGGAESLGMGAASGEAGLVWLAATPCRLGLQARQQNRANLGFGRLAAFPICRLLR